MNYLVVGGSSGIGLETVTRLLENGNTVYAASRTESSELQATEANYIELDVTEDEFNLDELPETIDGIVYCPGTIDLKPFHRIKIEQFRKEYEINVLGAIKVIQTVLPRMKKAESASVVLFSTVASAQGMPFHASIASAKAAVEGLARSLAAEYASNNIRFNVIAPSLTDTPLAARLLGTDDKREASAKRHPIKRVGTTTDMAEAALFLLKKDAWITGQTIHVDGGMSAVRSL